MATAAPLRRKLAALVVFGALVRLALLAAFPRVIRWDEPDYLWLGRQLWSGLGYQVAPGVPDLHYPPVFPLLVGPLELLCDRPEWASNLWYVLCGALLPVPVAALARRVWSDAAAIWAAVFTALFPLLTVSPLHWGTFTEPPYLLFLFVGIERAHAAWRHQGGARAAATAGAALGLGYLTRPEGFLYGALVGVILLAAAAVERRGHVPWRSRLLAYGVAFAALATPYILYLHHYSGRWLLTGKVGVTLDLWQGSVTQDPAAYDRAVAALDSRGEELIWFSQDRFTRPGLLTLLRRDPADVVRRVSTNLRSVFEGLWRRWPFLPPIVLVAVAGLIQAARDRRRRADVLFLAAMALPPLAFLPILIQVRFFAPMAPIFLLFAAAAATRLGEAWANQAGRPWLRHAPAALLALGLAAVGPRVFLKGQRSLDFGPKSTGLWIADHTPADAVVMARDPAPSLYGRRGFVPCPNATLGEMLAYGRRRGATLWATDERELTVIRPQLAFMLDAGRRPADLREIHRGSGRYGTTYVFALPTGE